MEYLLNISNKLEKAYTIIEHVEETKKCSKEEFISIEQSIPSLAELIVYCQQVKNKNLSGDLLEKVFRYGLPVLVDIITEHYDETLLDDYFKTKIYEKEEFVKDFFYDEWGIGFWEFINRKLEERKGITHFKCDFNPQPESQIKQTNNCILPDKLIDAMITQNLVIRSRNGLKWVQSASLYGYFIDLATKKLNLRTSSGRIKWKDFGFIENHNSLLATAKQAVNDYTNKGLNPPEGDDIVDKLFK